jgi:hypothetical protein
MTRSIYALADYMDGQGQIDRALRELKVQKHSERGVVSPPLAQGKIRDKPD